MSSVFWAVIAILGYLFMATAMGILVMCICVSDLRKDAPALAPGALKKRKEGDAGFIFLAGFFWWVSLVIILIAALHGAVTGIYAKFRALP